MIASIPIPLRGPAGDLLAWACMVCRTAYQQQESARLCCLCPICNKVNSSLPKAFESREHTRCSKQRSEERASREDARYFDRKVPVGIEVIAHSGPVFCAKYLPHQEGFFSSPAALRLWCTEQRLRVPYRAYVCTLRPLDLDVDALREQATSQLTESAEANVRAADWEGLQRLIDQWAKAQDFSDRWEPCDHYMVVVKEKKA